MFWIAISMTITANIIYHICAKLSGPIHPLVGLSVAYGVSLLTCLILFPLLAHNVSFIGEIKKVNWSSFLLGASIVLLETGFILAYRNGWSITNAALFANTCVAILMIPIAYMFFDQALTLKNALGIALAISGLLLMAR